MTRTEACVWQGQLFPDARGQGCAVYLPTICLDLRMSLIGADDAWNTEFLCGVRDMLQARLDTWHPSVGGDNIDHVMDAAVQIMVVEAIRIASEELSRRRLSDSD